MDFEEPIIFRNFIKRAGGEKARIVVLPQASGLKDTGKEYIQTFQSLGVNQKQVSLEFRERKDADKKKHLEALRIATGIFIASGTQMLITPHRGERVENPCIDRGLYVRYEVAYGDHTGDSV